MTPPLFFSFTTMPTSTAPCTEIGASASTTAQRTGSLHDIEWLSRWRSFAVDLVSFHDWSGFYRLSSKTTRHLRGPPVPSRERGHVLNGHDGVLCVEANGEQRRRGRMDWRRARDDQRRRGGTDLPLCALQLSRQTPPLPIHVLPVPIPRIPMVHSGTNHVARVISGLCSLSHLLLYHSV